MKIRKFLNQPFPFLDSSRHRWILILFSLVFGIFFVNVFVPFNINQWNKDSGFDEFIRLSGFGVIAAFVLLVSQIGLRKFFGIKYFRVWSFALWASAELLFMAALFILFQSRWDISINRFLQDIPSSFKFTLLGILIPYSLVILFLSQIVQKSKLSQLVEKFSKPDFDSGLINFTDEKGTIRFSIAGEHILYLESADNYVIIYYLSNNKPAKQILRNSMKNIEKLFTDSPLTRCHRSFMINLQKIEFVDYEKATCRVKLVGLENFIPVSRKFYPAFKTFTK